VRGAHVPLVFRQYHNALGSLQKNEWEAFGWEDNGLPVYFRGRDFKPENLLEL
jgi:hypothetical protein